MDKERDHTKFIIQRFDSYISGANTKGNFLLAFNTFLCGSIIANYKSLLSLIEGRGVQYLNVTLILIMIIGLITTGIIVKAVYPFVRSGNSSKEKYHSHLFFSSVAEYENEKSFAEAYRQRSDEETDEDMARQAYCLALGLKKKYRWLAWAMRIVFAELALLLIILIIISIY